MVHRHALGKIAATALTVIAATAAFGPIAQAEEPPAVTVGDISYTSHYSTATVTSPASMHTAWENASQSAVGGYCNVGIPSVTLNGLRNLSLCGAATDFISHVVVPIHTAEAGSWRFQIGADFARGSMMMIDGQVVQERWYGTWWAGNFNDFGNVFDYTANLDEGPHTIEIYGAEDCCDGPLGARFQRVGASAWTPLERTPDSTPPVITSSIDPAVPDGENGWYRTDPGVSFEVTDADSEIASTSPDCGGGTISADTAGTTFSCTASSEGGSQTAAVTLKRDATAPTATFDAAADVIAAGATYTFGSTPAEPSCTAADALSGPGACTVTGRSTAVGTHTLTATATDKAGNVGTSEISYTVAPWETLGFFKPIDMDGVVNTVKNGSTVPVKFQVYAGGAQVTDPTQVAFSSSRISCDTGAVEDAVEVTATGGTVLRYDTTAGHFVYNWATPKTAGLCYALTMTTPDSTGTTALFKLK